MVKDDFNWGSVALRFLMAALLVYLTYNPEGYSFYHWNVFTPRGTRAISHLILIMLAVGMSWSHLTRRLSGQIDTDQIA